MLRALPRLTLTDLKGIPNAARTAKRCRGRANGNYCGYGNNGQKSRGTTSRHYIGFEGGQTPFYRVVPRHGKINDPHKLHFHQCSVEKILLWIDQGRIDPKKKITMKVLRDTKCIPSSIKDGVLLLGTGKEKLSIPLDIEVTRATTTVVEAVEKSGGTIMCTYYDPVTLRYHLWEDKYKAKGKKEPIRPLPTKQKFIRYYTDPKHNGYLSEKGDGHIVHTPEQFQRWRQRHVVRSKIWQRNPEWAEKRQEWFLQGLIPTAEEEYAYEDPKHFSNFKGPVSRYFGSDPELLPGETSLLPGQLHRKGDSRNMDKRPVDVKVRRNPNMPNTEDHSNPDK